MSGPMRLESALTDLAFDLMLELEKGKRPREVVLRRAVSCAYYAVFHALCRLCADELVGSTAASKDRNAVYRSIDHKALKSALQVVRGDQRFGPEIVNMLTSAISIQDDRHLADYDLNSQKFGGKDGVLSIAKSAESIVIDLQKLAAPIRKALAVALIARPRKP